MMDAYEEFGGGPTAEDILHYYSKILLLRELRKGKVIVTLEEVMDYEKEKPELMDRIIYRTTTLDGMEISLKR